MLTPLLTLILPPSAVLGFIGCLMVLSDPISLRLYWRQWHPGLLRRLIPRRALALTLIAIAIAGGAKLLLS